MKRIIFLAALFGTQVCAIPSPDFSSAPPAPAGLTTQALIGGSHFEKRQGCMICPTCGILGGGGCLLHPVWRMLRVPMY